MLTERFRALRPSLLGGFPFAQKIISIFIWYSQNNHYFYILNQSKMGQIKVIIGANTVYATQFKTVVFKKSFENHDEKEAALMAASSAAFSEATYHPTASCMRVDWIGSLSDEDVFAYLEKCHSKDEKNPRFSNTYRNPSDKDAATGYDTLSELELCEG